MEKKIRYSILILFTICLSIFIRFIDNKLNYSILIVSPVLLLYYYFLLNLKHLVKKFIILLERIHDSVQGIDFAKTESLEELEQQNMRVCSMYEGTKLRHIKPFFSDFSNLFSFDEKIIDLGCGKGSALIAFKEAGFKSVTGVEISEKLCLIAKNNLGKLNIKNVEIINSDILDFHLYEDYDIFYMFNPFPAEIMRKVILDIEQSLHNKPREVKIIYMNPKHQDEISKSKLFKKLGEYNYDSEKSAFRKIVLYKNL